MAIYQIYFVPENNFKLFYVNECFMKNNKKNNSICKPACGTQRVKS